MFADVVSKPLRWMWRAGDGQTSGESSAEAGSAAEKVWCTRLWRME
jgi:hypothetical protein